MENNKNKIFVEKTKIKYEWLKDNATHKLCEVFVSFIEKEKNRIEESGLNIEDEPFELLKDFDGIFHNIEFKSDVLLKYLCIYDQSIDEKIYDHVDNLIEKILKEFDYEFLNIGSPLAQDKIFKTAFKVHNIGKLYIPKILFDKNVILDNSEKVIIQRQMLYTKELLEAMKFGKQIIDLCVGQGKIDETYLLNIKKCSVQNKAFKIMIILDKYCALISEKPYRKSYSKAEAIECLRKEIFIDEDIEKILDTIEHNI